MFTLHLRLPGQIAMNINRVSHVSVYHELKTPRNPAHHRLGCFKETL